MFDDQETGFSEIRIKGRRQAIDTLLISDKQKENAIVDVAATGFGRYFITDLTLVDMLAEKLGLTKPSARVQVLPPGQLTLLHLDNLDKGYISPLENNVQKNHFTDSEIEEFQKNPRSALRFLIMLENSMPGQVMIFGSDVVASWKKGDVIYWDWPTVVHSTVNTGFWDRPLLRISGLATEKTKDIIANGLS